MRLLRKLSENILLSSVHACDILGVYCHHNHLPHYDDDEFHHCYHLYSFQSAFKFELQKMWLYFYRRKAYRDSSGFEHVLLGELQTKNGVTQVSGFHNWLQFYFEEKKNNLANYYGYYSVLRYNEVNKTKHIHLTNYLTLLSGLHYGHQQTTLYIRDKAKTIGQTRDPILGGGVLTATTYL